MAQHSGFFNALESGGGYDRKYNADDYTSNMAAIISTGVRRSGDDDLKVTASGLTVTVAAGRAWIDGRWYYNDTALTIATVAPPVGTLSRKDGVYLQANANLAVRNIQLVYKTGTSSGSPTAPACTRDGGVYEIQLATITVTPNATSLTVTDNRADTNLCGWITSPVGYDDFFTSYDNDFNSWFTGVKNTLSSVTLFKQYMWRTVTSGSSTSSVTFNIPQYDPTGVDIINVYVNGLLETPTDDYTLNGSTITFTKSKANGTEIVVMCYKSIDGTGLGSVSDEITALQNQVAALGNINQYYYFCNGQTDNVQLSQILQNFFNGSTSDNKKMKIIVVGTFGATAAAAGSGGGSTTSRYRWFNFEPSAATNRQVTLDFYNCSPVSIQPPDGKFNTIFYGGNYSIEGLTLTAGGSSYSMLHLQGVDGVTANASISFTDCNITIHGGWSGGMFFFSEYGTFTNCKIIVINTLNSAAVFELRSDIDFIQVNGGRYYAYTGLQSGHGIGIHASSGLTSAAITVVGASFPSKAKTSLYQTDAVNVISGYISAYGMITPLTVRTLNSETSYIYGTLALNKD